MKHTSRYAVNFFYSRFFLCCFLLFQLSVYASKKEVSNETKGSSFEIIEKLAGLAGIQVNGTRPWDIQIHEKLFATEVLKGGSLALGETYMAGWWDCDKLDELVYRIIRANIRDKIEHSWQTLWALAKARLFNLQTKSRSLKAIRKHYDLGNDLFESMLDPTMAYSCGYWKNATNLAEAQIAKYDLIARKLGFKPGMRVLDIGCGWGGFAKYIATHYGVEVVGITLSENQAVLARQVNEGLPVEIRIQDYRDINESFDRIVEIGMFEHVGVKNYRQFMEIVYRSLKAGGMFMLHTIGSNRTSQGGDAWVHRYIFPDVHLPSVTQIAEATEGLFVMEDWHNFSADYDKTLMAWAHNFDTNWHLIKDRYPDPFYRMWKYYLLTCAGLFRARSTQLWQVVLSKGGIEGGYESVR